MSHRNRRLAPARRGGNPATRRAIRMIPGVEALDRRDLPAVVGPWATLDVASTIAAGQGQALAVDAGQLRAILDRAPMEFTAGAATSPALLPIPMPDGTFDRFTIVEAPIMEPGLAAQFPDIKTYRGQGIDDPTATLRLSLTPLGLNASIMGPSSTILIGPDGGAGSGLYVSYDADALPAGDPMDCDILDAHGDEGHAHLGGGSASTASYGLDPAAPHSGCDCPLCRGAVALAESDGFNPLPLSDVVPFQSGSQLRTYRMAMAATGEFTASYGGTVGGGLAAVTALLNQVIQVYENTLAIRFVLVANNASIIYTNAATDPYTGTDVGTMLDQNRTNLNAAIGVAGYDIGHVVTTAAGGGVAYLGVVGNSSYKGGGASGSQGMGVDGTANFYYRVAHEIGHQFSANHTFNYVDAQRNANTAYEYGYGTSIMSYGHLNQGRHPTLHHESLREIINYADTVIPNVGTRTSTGNAVPTVDAGPNYVIPANTPFVLTAIGSDPNGDPLTYSWEQRELGPAQNPGSADNGDSPWMRVRPPTSSPSRTFPTLNTLINNTAPADDERYFTANRTTTFRVVARDNRSGGGAVNWDDMTLTVVATGAAFAVTAPNTAVTWTGNTSQTVAWNVAGTNAGPVNTPLVNIFLSIDGGFTYSLLLGNTPNDGSEGIVVPTGIDTNLARIRIQGAGNIFFDISNVNFAIRPAAAPTTVTAVSSTASNGVYGIGATIPITIQFAAAVNVAGTPVLALNSGGTATYVSGSGTNTLTFAYVVGSGQSSPDLDYASASALTLSGGSIASGGVPASLTLPAVGGPGSLGANRNLRVDGVAPVVLEYRVLFGSRSYRLTSADRILPWEITGIQVVFSEAISSGDVASLAGLSGTSFSGLGGDTLTWGIGALTQGVFATSLLGSGASALRDAAGNPLLGGGYAQGFRVLFGDVDGDGFVSSADMTTALNFVGLADPFADLDGDGDVDLADARIARRRIGAQL
ncbi:reprolysin-like metallopeptidase [Tundrisphaera sp. TA3]|uniref:reprolysin-like metallopeptidase n=1 Tax=Tundrisphaera sp. TA3 TaxID=3435775 RepID=UPI003EB722AF